MIKSNSIPVSKSFYSLPLLPALTSYHYRFFLRRFDLPFNRKRLRGRTISSSSLDLMKLYSLDTTWICFFNGHRRNQVKMASTKKMIEIGIEDPPVHPGVDVFDAEMPEARAPPPEHLVVMVNGLMGSAADWQFAAQQFVKRIPDKVVVHCSGCNCAKLTMDGVDLMGERLADEVLNVVQSMPGLQKISFVSHSLGGLVARYAIGKLYEPPEQSKSNPREIDCLTQSNDSEMSLARIAVLEPMNFITVATPHLGSRGHRQRYAIGMMLTWPWSLIVLPALCGFLFLERQASQTAHLVAGRSGKHLFLTDNDDGKQPLLIRMVTDSYDYKFMSALRSFKRRVTYANTSYDCILMEAVQYVVGWRTSSIRRPHELPAVNLYVKNDKYPHIVYIEPESSESSHCQAFSYAQDKNIDIEEEMIRGLRQVPWVRVDVSFHNSSQRFVAHNTIQVNRYWLNSDGVGVISHMIDNFIL
ncbi:hypothetical protein V2J09_004232 [Rumex salicifolius]